MGMGETVTVSGRRLGALRSIRPSPPHIHSTCLNRLMIFSICAF